MNLQYITPIRGHETDRTLQHMIDHVSNAILSARTAQIERFLKEQNADINRDELVIHRSHHEPGSVVSETIILVPKNFLNGRGLFLDGRVSHPDADNMTMNDAKARFPWTQIKILITTGGKVR